MYLPEIDIPCQITNRYKFCPHCCHSFRTIKSNVHDCVIDLMDKCVHLVNTFELMVTMKQL